MDSTYVLFIVLLFVAVVLALEGAYQVWASKNSTEAKRVAARLRTLEGENAELKRKLAMVFLALTLGAASAAPDNLGRRLSAASAAHRAPGAYHGALLSDDVLDLA